MMKKTNLFKTLTAITTAALMFAIPVSSAFADGRAAGTDTYRSDEDPATFDITNGATSTGDVYIKINNNSYPDAYNKAGAVYKVDVTWTDLTFTYNGGTWDPDNHTYTSDGGWANDKNTGSITVKNHSNWAVKSSAAFGTSNTVELNGFTATLDNYDETSINACPIGAADDDVPSNTIDVTVTAGDVTTTEDFTLGKITVKITPDGNGTSNAPISNGTT
ncbi:MAG: hypothetical protein MJ100_04510 [Ruminococcus sp.]|nr:hypothetical protein [Ruminococcus sp.]